MEHLIKIIVRTIEGNASTQGAAGASDGVVQEDEMDRFLKQRSKGLALTLKSDLNASEMDWSEVMEGAKAKTALIASVLTIQSAFKFKLLRSKVKARTKLKESLLAASATRIQMMIRKHAARERFRAVVEARGQGEGGELYRLAKRRNRMAEEERARQSELVHEAVEAARPAATARGSRASS